MYPLSDSNSKKYYPSSSIPPWHIKCIIFGFWSIALNKKFFLKHVKYKETFFLTGEFFIIFTIEFFSLKKFTDL